MAGRRPGSKFYGREAVCVPLGHALNKLCSEVCECDSNLLPLAAAAASGRPLFTECSNPIMAVPCEGEDADGKEGLRQEAHL